MKSCSVVVSAGFITLAFFFAGLAKGDSTLGKAAQVTGKVWISPSSRSQSKVDLKADTALRANDLILAGPKGNVQLVLGHKGAAVLMKEDSIIRLIGSPDGDSGIELVKGSILAHIRPSDGGGSRFFVKTRGALLGVRGTTFFVHDNGGSAVSACVCDGTVALDQKVILVGKNHDTQKQIEIGSSPLSKRLKGSGSIPVHSAEEVQSLSKLLDGA